MAIIAIWYTTTLSQGEIDEVIGEQESVPTVQGFLEEGNGIKFSGEVFGRFEDQDLHEWIEVRDVDGIFHRFDYHSPARKGTGDFLGHYTMPDEVGRVFALVKNAFYRKVEVPT